MPNKRVAQPAPIRRVCDDMFGPRFVLPKEIDATDAIVALDEVRRDDMMSGSLKHHRNSAATAGRFPYGPVELLSGQ